jgi:hypothetical protein
MKKDGFPMMDSNCNCSGGASCCKPPASGPSRAFKTGVFTLVLLLALGVSTYSLFWRDSGIDVAGCDPGAGGCGGAVVTGIAFLDQQFIGADFGLVVLADASGSPTTTAAVGDVAARIMTTTRKLKVVNLTPDDPLFSAVIRKYALSTSPAVIALGGTGHVVLRGPQITAETLWQTFQKFGSTAANCCPADNPGKK